MPTLSEAQRAQAVELRQQGLSMADITARFDGEFTSPQIYAALHRYARQHGIELPRRQATHAGSQTFTRRFGIEIEFTGCTPMQAAQAMQAAGLTVEVQGYNHRTLDYWKIVEDSSVGYEAVSPILSGEDGYNQVRTAMKAIRQAGGRVNSRAGMHVHHDMTGLTGEAIARFVRAYVERQPHIDRLVARSRRAGSGNSYCSPVNDHELRLITSELEAYRRVPGSITRFKSINVQSFPRQGTVEVRQHHGCLMGGRAVAWIKFVQALIEASAVQDLELANDSLEALLDDLRQVGVTRNLHRYLLRRAEALSTTNTGQLAGA